MSNESHDFTFTVLVFRGQIRDDTGKSPTLLTGSRTTMVTVLWMDAITTIIDSTQSKRSLCDQTAKMPSSHGPLCCSCVVAYANAPIAPAAIVAYPHRSSERRLPRCRPYQTRAYAAAGRRRHASCASPSRRAIRAPGPTCACTRSARRPVLNMRCQKIEFEARARARAAGVVGQAARGDASPVLETRARLELTLGPRQGRVAAGRAAVGAAATERDVNRGEGRRAA